MSESSDMFARRADLMRAYRRTIPARRHTPARTSEKTLASVLAPLAFGEWDGSAQELVGH